MCAKLSRNTFSFKQNNFFSYLNFYENVIWSKNLNKNRESPKTRKLYKTVIMILCCSTKIIKDEPCMF